VKKNDLSNKPNDFTTGQKQLTWENLLESAKEKKNQYL